jgi:glycosyltransferase involved in cell wall biosynthesis
VLAPDLERVGIPVHRLDLSHRWVVPQGVSRLARVLRHGKYDVVHGHLFFAGLYVALTRPFVPDVHRIVTFHNLGYDSFPAHSTWRKLRKRLDALVMRHWIDRRVAVSTAVAEHYRAHLHLPGIDVIPNGFPVHRLKIDPTLDTRALLQSYGFSEDDFVVLVCGRLIAEKGHRYFFEALDLLRSRGQYPKALVVGDGPLRDQIADDVRRRTLEGQVRLIPAVPHSQLLHLMQAVDLVVMASTHEGFPLVPGEAMAMGRPVLATRAGGITDLVEDGVSGLLVPPAEPAALAAGMARLMADPDERRRLGRAASLRIAERFNSETLAGIWMEYYRAAAAVRLPTMEAPTGNVA